MELRIAKALEHRRLKHEIDYLRHTQPDIYDFDLIVGASGALQRVLNVVKKVADGEFREDLYYRLNVVSIDMPPLRERKEDIPELAQFFTKRFGGELNKKVQTLDPGAEKLLKRHNWPGNIRELENTIERAVLLAEEAPWFVRRTCVWVSSLPMRKLASTHRS